MKIIRVFPRRTKATPTDELAYVGLPSMFAEADEVHISAAFTWDLPEAERLEKEWRHIAPVKIGGPATGQKGEIFTPEMYLKKGYVITSRGCNNRCWFCSVWKREGNIKELPITERYIVQDDNLLSCSENHIRTYRFFDACKTIREAAFYRRVGGKETTTVARRRITQTKPETDVFRIRYTG